MLLLHACVVHKFQVYVHIKKMTKKGLDRPSFSCIPPLGLHGAQLHRYHHDNFPYENRASVLRDEMLLGLETLG